MHMGEKNTEIISPENIDSLSSYTVDTFDYVSDALKSQLLAKNLRQKVPLGGKIGYDVEGTLLGNWFKAGRDKNKREEYWAQNLSVVYDHIDESQLRISLGDFGGYPKAFGVKDNTPDPQEVTTNSGVMVYELVPFDYYDAAGNRWDTIHYVDGLTALNMSDVAGVVLFELVDEKTLKVEAFPGKTKSQVSGFTTQAQMYER